LPRLVNLPGLTNLRKTTCQGGFFVYRAKDYAQKEIISRRSSLSLTQVKAKKHHSITNSGYSRYATNNTVISVQNRGYAYANQHQLQEYPNIFRCCLLEL
ncbi:hypothetical protein AB0127_25645, partial [Klebsiella pneumoniae]